MAKAIFCTVKNTDQATTVVDRLKAAGFAARDISAQSPYQPRYRAETVWRRTVGSADVALLTRPLNDGLQAKYVVRVTPPGGTPYLLIDQKGDGQFSSPTQGPADAHNLSVPMWVIGTF